MEITNDIKAKIFAQYLGQKVTIPNNYKFDGCRTDATVGELTGVQDDFIKINGISGFYPVSDFKLILKPESKSMAFSEEDYKSFKKIESITEELLKDVVSKDDFVGKMMIGGFLSYQYAISKGIDFPQYLLEGKTLFECDLAIYEGIADK